MADEGPGRGTSVHSGANRRTGSPTHLGPPPKTWWPASWFTEAGEPKYWDPVCPLQRALYGHPESGAIWEKHLSGILEELGWERVAAHPRTWVHKETKALVRG